MAHNDDLIIELRHGYLLTDAFELLGMRLYGSDWTRNELAAETRAHPDERTHAHKELQIRIANADENVQSIDRNILKALDASEIAALKAKRDEAIKRRSLILGKQNTVYPPDASYMANHAAYERRCHVKAALIEALSEGRFDANLLNLGGIQSHWWRAGSGHKYYLEINVMTFPALDSRHRRGSVRINQQGFDAWLKGVQPLDWSKSRDTSEEEKAEFWFREQLQQNSDPVKKDIILNRMDELFDLSARKRIRIWDTLAPATWKKSGRKK